MIHLNLKIMSQESDKIVIHIFFFFFLLWEWGRICQKIIRRAGDGFVLENKHQLKIRKGMEEIKPPECKRVGDLHLQNHKSSVLIINPPPISFSIYVHIFQWSYFSGKPWCNNSLLPMNIYPFWIIIFPSTK